MNTIPFITGELFFRSIMYGYAPGGSDALLNFPSHCLFIPELLKTN